MPRRLSPKSRIAARVLVTTAAAAAAVLGTCADHRCRASAAPGALHGLSAHMRSDRPHPAVARIVVPEGLATSYGSGTLVDVRDQFGLVVTNWHVVRDARGDVEVIFPDGFRSKARPLKVDPDWDLAALVIWRPPATPVPIADRAPQPGDRLTICGYGQGQYRAATGRCTQYYAPRIDFPLHMVELDVEARQGDSGGPIFNERGELAGVLFGAGGGTTLGSFGGRVETFLATLAPDIGKATDNALVHADVGPGQCRPGDPCCPCREQPGGVALADKEASDSQQQLAKMWPEAPDRKAKDDADGWQAAKPRAEVRPVLAARENPPRENAAAEQAAPGVAPRDLFAHAKSVLAVIGVLALAMQVLRAAR